MEKERIRFDSSDGAHSIVGYAYSCPDTKPKAVLQIVHGMCEYIERYEWLASFCVGKGYILCGNDHLGHGSSVKESEYGTFNEENVLLDLKKANEVIRERYNGLPIIMYGHSMGSFFARWYAERYPDSIDGLILSGTAGPSPLNGIGKAISGFIKKRHEKGYVSEFLANLNFRSYLARIKDAKSKNDWLTHDRAIVEAYDKDPKCNFKFSAEGYHSMLTVLSHVSKRAWAQNLPKDMKILLIAGACDPVGNYGKGVKKVTEMLKSAGIKDVTEIIELNGRHELHNEVNKEEVMMKVIGWLNERIKA